LAVDPILLEEKYHMFGSVNENEAFGAQACIFGHLSGQTKSDAQARLPRLLAI
jgi:hypothetical protein